MRPQLYNIIRFIIIGLNTLALYSCAGSGSDGESANTSFIPNAEIECTSAQVAGCSGNSLLIYVGLIESLPHSCDSALISLSHSQRELLFLASGQTTSTRSGIFLAGTVSHWSSSSGANLEVLEKKTYYVCAFVDANANSELDVGEPISSSTIAIGSSGGYFTLNTWTAATY